MRSHRRLVLRAIMSALAGGGLTAVSLGGPLTGALGAIATTSEVPSLPGSDAGSSSTGPEVVPSQTESQPANTTPTRPTSSHPPASTHPRTSASPAPGAPTTAGPEAPTVALQQRQKVTAGKNAESKVRSSHAKPKGATGTTGATGATGATGLAAAPANNNVALPPQLVAEQAGALASALASSAASAQALAFYRIPLFLLPIYQAAAAQYGVPWQILAAINEIETNYGSDQSVSTAGAVGWMQFMPATWTQYGVDALNAGYADPYNPVDAVFAAARYLRAAGIAHDLRGAILAYNHSDEYANSVLLRAKLISTYPQSVIATLTGLVDDRPPVTGTQLSWGSSSPSPSSATANAVPVPNGPSSGSGSASPPKASTTPGSSAPPSPGVAAAVGTGNAGSAAQGPQLIDLLSAPSAVVVAVQDGRIVQLGNSRKLGKYVVLRDVYGDVFTYAGLGSIAPTYTPVKTPHGPVKSPVADVGSAPAPTPSLPASAGSQLPLTLHVKTPVPPAIVGATEAGAGQDLSSQGSAESTPAGMGKVRLFAHPGNPDALAAATAATVSGKTRAVPPAAGRRVPLRRGSVVAKGTVIGRVSVPPGAKDGHLRFAIRPVGDPNTIDSRAILANWVQLGAALHPQGVKGEPELLGATTNEVLLMSKSRLVRELVSDPRIAMSACSRHEVASGALDKRVLAVLAFLSRSGLDPTVSTLRCGAGAYAVSGYVPIGHLGDGVAITRINGIPVAGHQGSGSITDTTVRALLTLRGEFVPRQIVSLMRYPQAPVTLGRPDHGNYVEIDFSPAPSAAAAQKSAAAKAKAAHSAGAGKAASPPAVVSGELSVTEWDQLVARVNGLPAPTVSTKPSSSAIPDPKGQPGSNAP